MRDFFDCVQYVELMDIPSHGLHFTWNQKPKEGIGVLKKIDRIMSNVKFMDLFPDTYALFKPARVSDHSPCVMKLASCTRKKLKPFKFPNFLTTKEEFRRFVSTEWAKDIEGFAMFSVVKKMRNLKPSFRKLLYQQGNLHEKVIRLRKELDDIQQLVDANPLDVTLRDTAAKCLRDYQVAAYDEECFLKQKSKVEWLCAGDSNTSFFHKCVKSRNARNKISCIKDVHGNRFEGDGIPGALVDHYSSFLGTAYSVSSLDDDNLFLNTLSSYSADHMIRQVTREEVKQAMFGIGENKAPGPDGFTSAFFKQAWDIVGDEVTNAVLDFFDNGKLLKQVNHTILALVPKVDTPNSVLDYRPISCCNVIYKCISKIITDRLKGSLDTLVSINQSAFVPGRKITDNILLTQELMHNYHLNKGQPRCAFKIDIQKAYDTVSWSFLESILKKFGFHHKMIIWIMTCVTSVSYSLSINGELHGYFEGKRGLRQGDPMSPYLFTLVMEVLTLILQQVATNTSFKFHGKCSKQKIINILFADDLFLFSHGDSVSVKHLKLALDKFTQISGLVPSMPKSTVYFSNVTSAMKNQILNLLPFQEGSLPVRYLGVPLISTRLAARDCKILIERTQRRIDNWVTKSLSFAGRLQLINSVLAAMYSYWASVFLLPIGIVKDLEKRLRRFLWNGGNQGPVRAKVAWKEVCTPKDEGGLGIRSIMDANKAFLTTHIWSIITNRPSLWVQWIHSYRLKGNNFWEVQCRGQVSWGWRKLLAIRPSIRPFVWSSIYSGRQTNVWSDNWCAYSPLRSFISPRNIARAGFSLSTTVADVVSEDGQWRWPQAWYDTFPVLINIATIQITPDTADRFRWKDWEGKLQRFCSWEAWNNLRYKENKVVWVNSVWFSQCIPRHSFHLWLVIKNKLRTQDRMAEWEAGSATNLRLMCCPLCRYDRDSRDHLFFECSYASEVWRLVRNMVDMESVDDTWASVMQWMELNANSSSLDYIVCNLLLAASTYFIWQERNNRLFTQVQRNASVLSKVIIDTIRLRIMGFKTGRDPKQRKLLDRWLIAKTNMDVDPG
ncbi:putative RNA-directed DNA polymerase [Helianthus annuus]|nr:putative RNA-directed DNA polymerase [Helianthus annuus]